MDPPTRPHSNKRRSVSMQPSNAVNSQNFATDASPSPFVLNTPSMSTGIESQRPPSRGQHLVSMEWKESNDSVSRRTSTLEIELAECVETKTVTTTTTTKRSYPPLLIQQHSLATLDVKEYPLALKETPADISKFSYGLNYHTLKPYSQVQKREVLDVQVYNASRNQANSLSAQASSPRSFSLNDSTMSAQHITRTRSPELAEPQHADKHRLQEELVQNTRSGKIPPEIRPKSSQSMGPRRLAVKASQRQLSKGLGMRLSDNALFPATPDASEVETSTNSKSRSRKSFFDTAYTPHSGRSQEDLFGDVASPSDSPDQDAFENAVATPPIADSDLEPSDASSMVLAGLPALDTLVAQNASLPSPGLSPTPPSADLDGGFPDSDGDEDEESPVTQSADSQDTLDEDRALIIPKRRGHSTRRQELTEYPPSHTRTPSMMDTTSMLATFDAMPNDMQSFMMYQFLRRCSRKTLHVIANAVNPALKCDFLDQLPLELSLHILSFLDFRDHCRAAQVSKQWRIIVDTNETGWKDLLDRDGFVLPAGELEKAIKEGWGWQDPYGLEGCEENLSVTQPTSSSSKKVESEPPSRGVRASTKRKRGLAVGGERSKRAAHAEHEFSDKAKNLVNSYPGPARFHKSEGPFTAATAAVVAVPDPGLGLPTLRTLHLFKSLYRRHYLIQESWMSGKIEPHHFAFAAHPNHVITCLQFDDDKIITGSDDTFIHVYSVQNGQLRKKLAGHDGGVWALQYEGNVLVSGSTDRSVRVWDIEKGICTQVFDGHTSTVRCLQILMPELVGYNDSVPIMVPEKPLIITGSRDSQLRVWRLPEQGSKRYIQTGPPVNDADCPYFVRVLTGHTHSVRAIAAHRDTLVSGSYDNTVRVWKISTGETVHRLQGHTMKVYSVVLDHKRNRCISGSMDNFVKIWCLETGACLFTLDGHSSLVGLLDLRDERLVSAAADSTLRIWDPENGQCKSTLSAHTGAITCFQHDSRKVISGSDRTLKMWNVKTGECTKDLLTDLTGVWQVKFGQRRCVAAVQRDNRTFVEVIDFGASRDGVERHLRGVREIFKCKGPFIIRAIMDGVTVPLTASNYGSEDSD